MTDFIIKFDLKYWGKIFSLWGASLLSCWTMRGVYENFKKDMAKWDSAAVEISQLKTEVICLKTTIDSLVKQGRSEHLAMKVKIDLHDSVLFKTHYNQEMLNRLRAYRNDTITVHTAN